VKRKVEEVKGVRVKKRVRSKGEGRELRKKR
jgi:hypothetical protein